MKNIITFNNNVKCSSCDLNGFFCYTPKGGDYITCPLCNNPEYGTYTVKPEYDINKFYDDENDLRNILYCDSCRILFKLGCIHAENGCSQSIFNGHLIGKWQDKTTNETYNGMPQYDSLDEWYNEVNNIKILGWICPNKSWHCNKAAYPEVTHPKSYTQCSLV